MSRPNARSLQLTLEGREEEVADVVSRGAPFSAGQWDVLRMRRLSPATGAEA